MKDLYETRQPVPEKVLTLLDQLPDTAEGDFIVLMFQIHTDSLVGIWILERKRYQGGLDICIILSSGKENFSTHLLPLYETHGRVCGKTGCVVK